MSNGIRFEKHGALGKLILERPEKLNAQTPALWAEMATQLGPRIEADPDLRVLVLEGEGRCFSAGIDIATFTRPQGDGLTGGGSRVPPVQMVTEMQNAFMWLERAPFLTIAKVHSHALGAGMQLALACDIRIASDDVQMGLLEMNWGLMPDLGGTVWLPRLIGPARALEIMITGEKLGADRLLELGIVNRVVPRAELDAAVDAFVELTLSRPPIAVRGAKRAVHAAFRSTEEGMLAAAYAQVDCLQSEDFREAGQAFVEGRPPRYQNR